MYGQLARKCGMIYIIFKVLPKYKIAEIGSYKGFTTRELAKTFSEVYAVDNNIVFSRFNKKLNREHKNIHYVILDIYKSNWDILPKDIL